MRPLFDVRKCTPSKISWFLKLNIRAEGETLLQLVSLEIVDEGPI